MSELLTAPKKIRVPTKVTPATWDFDLGLNYLCRHIPSGTYYGRIRVGGKMLRKSLKTTDLLEAKERLPHFVLASRQPSPYRTSADPWGPPAVPMGVGPTFGEAAEIVMDRIRQDPALSPKTVRYWKYLHQHLARSWSGIELLRAREFSEEAIREWGSRTAKAISACHWNNVLGLARKVWRVLADKTGIPSTDPSPFAVVKRLGKKPRKLSLPEPDQWKAFIGMIDTHPTGGQAQIVIRLLAFFGLRHDEAKRVVWGDFDWARGVLHVKGGKDRLSASTSPHRLVPIIQEARDFFEPLAKDKSKVAPVITHPDMRWWFKRAHRLLGLPRWSHHDMRHLFATRCIESGVDIPTVSRWLGHKDGGVLAMQVYGHLRDWHSQDCAKKVKFA